MCFSINTARCLNKQFRTTVVLPGLILFMWQKSGSSSKKKLNLFQQHFKKIHELNFSLSEHFFKRTSLLVFVRFAKGYKNTVKIAVI